MGGRKILSCRPGGGKLRQRPSGGRNSEQQGRESCEADTAWLGENIAGETESGRTVCVGENGQVRTEEAHRQERKETGGRDEGQRARKRKVRRGKSVWRKKEGERLWS